VIEIDGDSHNAEYDLYRDNYLEDLQIKTIRYTNDEVMSNGNKVANDIKQEMRIREVEL
jgi:very-short-patch-repair endonuclease